MLFLVFGLPGIIRNYKLDNRLLPDGYRVDHRSMNRDLAIGKSKNKVMVKYNRGGYDVKK